MFIPMEIPEFGYDIRLPKTASPDDPTSIFDPYCTLYIINQIVNYTNKYLELLETLANRTAQHITSIQLFLLSRLREHHVMRLPQPRAYHR